MAEQRRIPRGIDPFDPYINRIVAYLQEGNPTTNAERVGIGSDEVQFLSNMLTEWKPLYLKYTDKKNTRTTAVIDQAYNIIDQVITYDQTRYILDRIAVSPNATIVDMEVFNIRKGALQKTNRSVQTKSISEPVSVTLQSLGGGIISAKCYSSSSARASIFDEADSVQYSYLIGTIPPTSPSAEGMIRDLSTKGSFNFSVGDHNGGKNLYIYFRWYNTKHPELAGPWCSIQIIWIT
jgi:hypothetical protein